MIVNALKALVALLPVCAIQAFGAPTLIDNVHGYTLAHNQLITFDGMVFDDGKVVTTGRAALLKKRFPRAEIVDGHNQTLLPGMIDAHGHVYALGTTTTDIVLDDTESMQEALERIRDYANANPDRTWLTGAGWNQVKWKLGRFPTAAELDAVVSDRPVVLWRVDGHAQWLNSQALRVVGITKSSVDPAGGRIERDTQGNPSGVLVDKATDIVDAKLPAPTPAERRAQVIAALKQINSLGLTSVGDAGNSAAEIALYRELADQGLLSVRIYAMILDTGDDFKLLSKDGPLIGYGNDRLTVRAVKLIADGALGSRGAALLAPYSDQPTERGLLQMSDAVIEEKIENALKAGYQVNIHAIGDAANRQVLDGFETAYKAVGGRQLRNRIEHAQIISLADIPRLKQLDLIASMQPTHATSDMNMAEDRVGRERLNGAYAWRTLLTQGTRIAAGSDFPVESANPFYGLHAAVTRTDHAGNPRGGWHAEQAMTLLEAFRAFTLDAAYAQHQESTIGSLEPGKWADFILIDRDLFKIPSAQIWQTKVQQTWVAGRSVYAAATRSLN